MPTLNTSLHTFLQEMHVNPVNANLLESGINVGTVTKFICDWFGK